MLDVREVMELAQKLRDHAKEHRGIDMTLEMDRQKVQEANPV